jgi:monofunctional glycosyltransferase
MRRHGARAGVWSWLGWLLLAGLALQVAFVLRLALMVVVDPHSTSFQRSEAWRLAASGRLQRWSQVWLDGEQISPHLKRAVIASEDDGFLSHGGVDWRAIESAWSRNERRAVQAQRQAAAGRQRPAKLVGGSTITQQLAKNLLLSGERTLWRKGQELLLSLALEALLSKPRILEIYLNSVEWGEGVFGAEAAAKRYFGKSARYLTAHEAARLAVMLPAPKRYEKRPDSPYLLGRAATIQARMAGVTLP